MSVVAQTRQLRRLRDVPPHERVAENFPTLPLIAMVAEAERDIYAAWRARATQVEIVLPYLRKIQPTSLARDDDPFCDACRACQP